MRLFGFGRGTPEAATTAEEKESSLIKLPEDETRVKQLEAKLEEYKGRLEEQKSMFDVYQAPEKIARATADVRYKIAVLERLLRDGVINTHDLSLEIHQGDSPASFDAAALNNAFAVIDGYAKTGDENIIGGTGLPTIEKKKYRKIFWQRRTTRF